MKNKPIWKEMLDYINNKEINSLITRKELLENMNYKNARTIDTYRWLLVQIGCLKYKKSGVYELKNKIPYFSLQVVKDMIYSTVNGK